MRHLKIAVYLLLPVFLTCCGAKEADKHNDSFINPELAAKLDTAIFASGCFWCTEAVFERVEGVIEVVSGYSGGTQANPTYREVSAGRTDHAEAVRIRFDPEVVSYSELVEMFFASHDPTQLNRQGPDIGKQYRSAIFYKNEEQRVSAEKVKRELEQAGNYDKPVVTEVTAFSGFYEAEDYHQDYYASHPNDPYIGAVSKPKVDKFEKEYRSKLKNKYQP